jgi:hypothetical protein
MNVYHKNVSNIMSIGFCIIIDKKNKDDIFNLFKNEILELGYIFNN